MTSLVSCPSCGKPTPMSRLMCLHCGAKLHGGGARPVGVKGRGQDGCIRTVQKIVSTLVRLAVVVVLAGVVGMGLWALPKPVPAFEDRDVLSADAKIDRLHASVRQGQPDSAVFHENEINAYFQKLLEDSGTTESKGMTLSVQVLHVDLRENDIRILLISGLGPVALSWELVFLPETNDEGFHPVPQSARVGHLPMPGPLQRLVSAKYASLFSDLPVEKRILGRLESLGLNEDQVVIHTRGKSS